MTSDDIDKFTDEQFTAFMHASGFDARIDAALAEAHAGKLPLYTRGRPSVEPAGMAEPAHIVSAFRQSERENAESVDVERFIEAVRRSALLGRREPTVMLRMWVKYAEVIQRHYAALPTQASDSPEYGDALHAGAHRGPVYGRPPSLPTQASDSPENRDG